MTTRHAGMKALVALACGHSHYRRKLATPGAEVLQCPYCGEFGPIDWQSEIRTPDTLHAPDDSDTLFSLETDTAEPPF